MLQSLKGIERMKGLKINELDLTGNQIKDSTEIQRLKEFKELKKLRIEGNQISVTASLVKEMSEVEIVSAPSNQKKIEIIESFNFQSEPLSRQHSSGNYKTASYIKKAIFTGSLCGSESTLTENQGSKPRLFKNDDSSNPAVFGGSSSSGGNCAKTACSPGKEKSSSNSGGGIGKKIGKVEVRTQRLVNVKAKSPNGQ